VQALLDLEKTNGHGKADRMAAVRAEKMRTSTKADYRRSQNLQTIADIRDREKGLLVFKHQIPDPIQSGQWSQPEGYVSPTRGQFPGDASGGGGGSSMYGPGPVTGLDSAFGV
jgi:hypothetical protein